ncbi:MAG: glycyl-radical enzyme activating protein [Propionivibrio sp.]
MQLNVFRKGFNYSQDGPGNRLVYHLQGCNMRCAWCSNPEGMARKGTLLVEADGLRESVCPHGAIVGKAIDRERCASCATRECLTVNRNQHVRWSSAPCDVEALVAEAKRSVPLYFDGGGVTLSGGEVSLQFAAAKKLLQLLREEGIHTTIETNGAHRRLGELLPLVDCLIIDFKHYDDARLRAATGVGTALVQRSVRQALAGHPDVLIRIPLIGGFNDSAADAEQFAAFFRSLDTARARFELLSYHEYGKGKWAQCGLPYRMENAFVGDETVAQFKSVFEANGLHVIHT